jgi:hypothetical protein
MFCLPVTKTESSTLMSKLNAAKSPGPDKIGPKVAKQAAHLLSEPFMYIFNLSLSSGIVPAILLYFPLSLFYSLP